MIVGGDVEQMISLTRADVPIELQKSFHALRSTPLFYVSYCKKLNKNSKVQKRVILCTLDHLYVCHPNGDILRCVTFDLIARIIHDAARQQMALIIPSEYDVLVEVPNTYHLIQVIETLRGLHPFDTPLAIETVQRRRKQVGSPTARGMANGAPGAQSSSPGARAQAEMAAATAEADRAGEQRGNANAEDETPEGGGGADGAGRASGIGWDDDDDDGGGGVAGAGGAGAAPLLASEALAALGESASIPAPGASAAGAAAREMDLTDISYWGQVKDFLFYLKRAMPFLRKYPPGVISGWNDQYFIDPTASKKDNLRNRPQYRALYERRWLFRVIFFRERLRRTRMSIHSSLQHTDQPFISTQHIIDEDPFEPGENVAGAPNEICIGKGAYTVQLAKPIGFRLSLYTGDDSADDEYDIPDYMEK